MPDMETNKLRTNIRLGNPGGQAAEEPLVREVLFPVERTIRWMPQVAARLPPPGVDLVVSQEVLLQVNAHVAESFDKEIGGFLLGNRNRCPEREREFVVIDQHTPARFTEENAVSLKFTHETFLKLAEELKGKFNGKLLVGWYHSHPKMHVFLSGDDMTVHEQRFGQIWQSALVIGPDQHLGGFFCRRAGVQHPSVPVEFFERLDGEEAKTKQTVMSWEGYDALDPSTSEKIQPARSKRSAHPRHLVKPRPAVRGSAEKLQPFPSARVIHWLPKGEQSTAAQASCRVVVGQSVLETIRHDVDAGGDAASGFLLGNSYLCPNTRQRYQMVNQLSPAPLVARGEAFVFSEESCERIEEDLEGKYLGKELLGWYQSTSLGQAFWPEPSKLGAALREDSATVIMLEPNQDFGVVQRPGGASTPKDFFEFCESGGEATVAYWSNYERDPSGNPRQDSSHPAAPQPQTAFPDEPTERSLPHSVAPLVATHGAAPQPQTDSDGRQTGFFNTRLGNLAVAFMLLVVLAAIYSLMSTEMSLRSRGKRASNAPVLEVDPLTIAVIEAKLEDPKDTKKGVRITLDISPPPKGFDLEIHGQKIIYKELPGEDGATDFVRVQGAIAHDTIVKSLASPAGSMDLLIRVTEKGTGHIGIYKYPLRTSDLVRESQLIQSVEAAGSRSATAANPAPPKKVTQTRSRVSEKTASEKTAAEKTASEKTAAEKTARLSAAAGTKGSEQGQNAVSVSAIATLPGAISAAKQKDPSPAPVDLSSWASSVSEFRKKLGPCSGTQIPGRKKSTSECKSLVYNNASFLSELGKLQAVMPNAIARFSEVILNPGANPTEKDFSNLHKELGAVWNRLKPLKAMAGKK